MNDYNIKKLYEDIEIELIASMKRNYKRHLKEEDKTGFKYSQWQAEKLKELKRYQRENKNIISGYTKGLPKEISKHLNNELKEGSIKAINQYNKVMGKNLKPNKIMNHSFFRTNDRKVNALIKVVNNDLKTANTAVLRMANDQYRQVIHKSAFFVANGVFTEKQAANMATKKLTELQKTKLAIDEANKDFLNRGFNCIEYKDGRRVNIASYSQMAVRTASLRAQLMGEGDFRKSIGRVLVQSTSHGGACPICQKWENKIFIDDVYSGGTKKDGKYMLLSEAMKQGFLHPNCRHGLTTYYPEVDNIENYSDEEYEDDVNWINNRINELTSEELNYINRNIKRFDRLENGSIVPLNIRRFAQKKEDLLNKKDEIIEKFNFMQYKDITSDATKSGGIKTIEPQFVCNFTTTDEKGNKITYTSNNAKFRKANLTTDEKKVINRLRKELGWNMNLLREIENPTDINVPDVEKLGKIPNDYYEIKSVYKSENKNSQQKKIQRCFDEAKKQSNKVIINIGTDTCDLTNEMAIEQIEKMLNREKYSSIFEEVIFMGKDKYLKYFKKNKKN